MVADRPLSRTRVLAQAVALADADGLDALSMRALSARLGVVPMALYKHVVDKDDLLDGLAEAVISEFATPEPGHGADWRVGVRAACLDARSTLDRHPWARGLLQARTHRTPAVLRHMDALTRLLLAGGLSPDLAHHAMHALGSRIWGFSPELFPGEPTPGRRADSPLDPADFPGIVAVAADSVARRPGGSCDEDFEFVFALDLLLDGLARLHASGWVSSA